MSMSDCLKCWDTPCSCGWDYRDDSVEGIRWRINLLQKVLQFKLDHPNAVFSKFLAKEETEDDKEFMKYMEQDKEFMKYMEYVEEE